MTYSMIGRCTRTGAYGGVVATSALAVGNRCLKVQHGRGAFLSQHRTDPRLADMGIDHLAEGQSAEDAIERVVADRDGIEWRQLAALDASGNSAVHHGRMMYSIFNDSAAPDCIAIGNILATPDVTLAMAAAFAECPDDPLAERLLRGLEAGRDAGGEVLEPVRSAALLVSGEDGIAACDLRIDVAEEAVAALRSLHDRYGDQHGILRGVALHPDEIPVARTLFEASVTRIAELNLEDRFPTAAHRDRWLMRD
jgi:uncharacterized Ntn-hydrolase superfamily protein